MQNFLLGIGSSLVAALILTFGTSRGPLGHRVSFRTVVRDVQRLIGAVNAEVDYSPEAIVSVNRSGAIVGSIMSGTLRRLLVRSPLTVGTVYERHNGIRLTRQASGRPDVTQFACRLLVACVNDSGESMRVVLEWIREVNPNAEIRTAAVYSSDKASIQPTYVAQRLGATRGYSTNRFLTRLPWMGREWVHGLALERGAHPRP